jgi:hypothetical protein
MTPRARFSVLLALPLSTSCTALADLDIQYRDCVAPTVPYVEQFDEGDRGLLDRCWAVANVEREDLHGQRKVVVGAGDLIIGYSDAQMQAVAWDADPPMLIRRVEGDFVFATKVEVTSGTQSNFCGLGETDAAGIIVRAAADAGNTERSASFLVRPYFANEATIGMDCRDEAENPPTATAEARSSVDGDALGVDGIGMDGEADIAVCRKGKQLLYFYRHPANPEDPWDPQDWQTLQTAMSGGQGRSRSDEIGDGPMEVGVTTTLGVNTYDLHVQGHFNWAALVRVDDDLEECGGVLEHFLEPASD